MENISKTFEEIDPDLVFYLAAESHVDKSIEGPEIFLKSDFLGTFNLLEVSREHFVNLSEKRKKVFRFHYVSTDEVFGSLNDISFLKKVHINLIVLIQQVKRQGIILLERGNQHMDYLFQFLIATIILDHGNCQIS